jgi:FlaA1/EpsC-like NDP-sugar epimerase
MNKPLITVRNRYLFLVDLVIIAFSVCAGFLLRLDLDQDFVHYIPTMGWMVLAALAIKPIIFWSFGLYRRMWAYASIKEMLIIVATVTVASLALAVWVVVAALIHWTAVPRLIPIIDWVVTLCLVGGFRLSIRTYAEIMQARRRSASSGVARRVLIAGAGDAGALVAREMQKNPQLHMQPVAFLDDAPEKMRQHIHGIPVLGRIDQVARVALEQDADEVIIAMPSASGEVFRRLTDLCRKNKLPFRTMPGIYELVGGRASASRLRQVDVGDLLHRALARTSDQAVGRALSGKRVLVTGAGGSIGLELCRQIARWGPSDLILLGHGENSIFEALLDLGDAFPSLPIHPVIADIRDRERLAAVFHNRQPQVVFHAAAHKHVPLMEMNVEDAYTNNVIGTQNVVQEALSTGVERLVLISSDKAIRPNSIMGATKRIAEMIVQDAARRNGRAFASVRFGNVLGSRGSVIPVFRRQIARGGPVTITHPEMERYFMTIPEAVHLVLQAATLGEGGETFILRMGKPVRIVSLAEDLIRLSGLEPGKDIPIVFSGIRPGEKLSEQLWDDDSKLQTTANPDVLRLMGENHEWEPDALLERMAAMAKLAESGETEKLLDMINETVGGTLGQSPPPDLTAV